MIKAIFHSTSIEKGYPRFRERSGEIVEILGQAIKDGHLLYDIQFKDGQKTSAFPEELTLLRLVPIEDKITDCFSIWFNGGPIINKITWDEFRDNVLAIVKEHYE